ncbi:MAG: flagellar biosynthetic protein FliR [Oscillospiraceae bacterium]|nr:flagellar biosynthetic protein FliR [Oscillospiraceae bacterium]
MIPLTLDNITIFTFVFMRMTGCIFFNPILGRREFPNPFKVGLTILLTFTVMAYTTPQVPTPVLPIEYMVHLLFELLVGYVIGFIITLFISVIAFGGEVIDMQMGMSMSKVYDPQSNAQMSISATFLNIMFIFLFLAANAHINLLNLFLISERLIPFGEMQLPAGLAAMMMDLFCQCTILAVKLALPVIAMEKLLEIGVGIIMKAIPQINVFVINIQAKLLVGIIMLLVLFVPFSNFLDDMITGVFENIDLALGIIAS